MSKRFVKGRHGRYHVDDDGFASLDGRDEKPLSEPVPRFFSRPGDGVLQANGFTEGTQDNNTMIVFGRDRTGEGEIDTRLKEFKNSLGIGSYGDYMAAGAIDIVVGRMAPFPLKLPGKSFGPLFTTKGLGTEGPIKELQTEFLEGIDDQSKYPFFTTHPGYAMDAARIYISQMTDVDHNFNIERSLSPGVGVKKDKNKRTPCSAIMTKADRLRFHARQDIKIVTGGSEEQKNSAGNDITEIGGIHLMAGNEPASQQPIPKGDNLVEVLKAMNKKISQLSGIVFSLAQYQIEFNTTLGTHVHHSPFWGISTTPSITAGPQSIKTILSQFTMVETQIDSMKAMIIDLEDQYLKSKGKNYINSKFNTTN